MNTIILPTHQVRVDRGRSKISTEVAAHEIAVLEAVHGRGAVVVLRKDIGDRDYPASAEVEWNRLRRLYDNRNDAPVGRAFPTFYELERYGFRTDHLPAGDGDADLGVMNIARRPPRRLGAEAATTDPDPDRNADDFAYIRDGAGKSDPDADPAAAQGVAPLGETAAAAAPAPEKPAKAGKAGKAK